MEISFLNANSVEPDQTLRSMASDLGLHCFHCPFYQMLGIIGLTVISSSLLYWHFQIKWRKSVTSSVTI